MAPARTEDIARRLSIAAPELAGEIVRFETSSDSDQTSKLLGHGGKGGASVLDETRDGQLIEVTRSGPANRPPRELGRAVRMALLDRGASDIIARTKPEP
jgi:hypothetical protein